MIFLYGLIITEFYLTLLALTHEVGQVKEKWVTQ